MREVSVARVGRDPRQHGEHEGHPERDHRRRTGARQLLEPEVGERHVRGDGEREQAEAADEEDV